MATTIISVEDSFGLVHTVAGAHAGGLGSHYQRMSETVRFFSTLPLLTFDDTAAEHYERDSSRRSPDWPHGPPHCRDFARRSSGRRDEKYK